LTLQDARPILALTMGDAAGVGPEIIVRALDRAETYALARPLVIGDLDVFQATLDGMKIPLTLHVVENVTQAFFRYGTIDLLNLNNIRLNELTLGQVCPMAGRAAVVCVLKAVDLAMNGSVDAIVTAPLHKEAMDQAGYHYPGHTEILAEKTHTKDYRMMLTSGKLRVVLVTTHVALRKALDMIDQERVLHTIRMAEGAMRRLGIENPQVAVAGVNPHAGEGGLFGREEIDILKPTIAIARAEGIDAQGPFPPDTVFYRALKGQFDVVVVMYHDQGLIPIKLFGFGQGVNVTLGLPIIRTSVDHGTAFGKAWQWRADPGSMIDAIEMAVKLAQGESEGERYKAQPI
jgi:4-hydroxythreonine-4-phosphate dehydrogenase